MSRLPYLEPLKPLVHPAARQSTPPAVNPLTIERALREAQAARSVATQERTPPLTEEDEQNLLGGVISGLDYVGGILDKPGAAARGVISGITDLAQGDSTPDWGGGLLNLIPFSDSLGITDRSDRISGRDLLEQWGAPQNKPGFFNESGDFDTEEFIWDLGGFLTEVPLDPLIAVTGPAGSFAKGSKALKVTEAAGDKIGDLAGALKSFDEAIASKTGAALRPTPAKLVQQVRDGERGLAGIRLPFAKSPLLTLGAGSEKAARAMELAGYNPVSRYLRSFFSYPVRGKANKEAQVAADLAFNEKENLMGALYNLAPEMNRQSKHLFKKFGEIADHFKQNGDIAAFNDFSRAAIEASDGVPDPQGLVQMLAKHLKQEPANLVDAVDGIDEMTDTLGLYLDGLRKMEDAAYGLAVSLGANGKMLDDDYIAHFGRGVADDVAKASRNEARSGLGEGAELYGFAGRNDIFRHIPGGTPTINAASRDALVTSTKGKGKELAKELKDTLRREYGVRFLSKNKLAKWLEANPDAEPWMTPLSNQASPGSLQKRLLWERHIKPALGDSADDEAARWWGEVAVLSDEDGQVSRLTEDLANGDITRDEFDEAMEGLTRTESKSRLDQLVNRFRSMPESVLQTGMYDKTLAQDFFNYMHGVLNKAADLRYAHNLLTQPNVIRKAGESAGEGVPLARAWNNAKFSKRGLYTYAIENHADELGLDDQTVRAMKAHLEAPDVSLDKFHSVFESSAPEIEEFIGNLEVSPNHARALKAIEEASRPVNKGNIAQVFDRAMAVWKGNLTIPFPSFHGRNLLSGVWMSWSEGKVPLRDILAGYRAAIRHVESKGSKPLKYLDEIKQLDILGKHGQMLDITQEAPERIGDVVPLPFVEGVKEGARKSTGEGWRAIDPTNVRGNRWLEESQDKGQHLLAETGERAYDYVEFLNRAGYYEALRRKGYSPAQAAHHVKRSQFDYSELSWAEKNIMRRSFPFYTWLRKSIPFTLEKLLDRPGGRTAQTIRALSSDSDPDKGEGTYVPRFLRERVALPVGGEDDNVSFLVQAGIPVEDLNNFVMRNGLPGKRTLEKVASSAHPAAIWLYETLAGKQLFTGKPLNHMDSVTEELTPFGRVVPVDHAISKSPLARYFGEARRYAEEGKAPHMRVLDALLGTDVRQYDTEKWRALDLESGIREELADQPYVREGTFQYLYEPEGSNLAATPYGQSVQQRLAQSRAVTDARRELMRRKELEELAKETLRGLPGS